MYHQAKNNKNYKREENSGEVIQEWMKIPTRSNI